MGRNYSEEERKLLRHQYLFMFSQPDYIQQLTDFINRENCKERVFGTKTILHYANTDVDRFVHTFHLKKKHGGKRLIVSPNRPHKRILKRLNDLFQIIYEQKTCVCGFIAGKSLVDNARPHVGRKYILSMDLKNFFPSISRERVQRMFCENYRFSTEASMLLSGLCCGHEYDAEVDYLPQGFPTSPILSNMVCEKLDDELMALADSNHLTYTRYADDITFSSDEDVLRTDGIVAGLIGEIISKNGFELNDKKTHLQRCCRRQEVTGIVVNQKVNLSRRYIREVRSLLYIWDRYGYQDARLRAYPRYRKQHGTTKGHGGVCLEHVLLGKLKYLRMVRGADDPVYCRLMDKYNQLVEADKERWMNSAHQRDANLELPLFAKPKDGVYVIDRPDMDADDKDDRNENQVQDEEKENVSWELGCAKIILLVIFAIFTVWKFISIFL